MKPIPKSALPVFATVRSVCVYLIFNFSVGLGLASMLWTEPVLGASALVVRFFSVGQADAVLVRCPDDQGYLLIDAADTRYPGSSDRFRADLLKEFDGKPLRISVVVASHPHADHIGSMKWVLEKFEVQTYVDNGEKFDSALWASLDKLRKQQIKKGKLRYINGKQAQSAEIDFCPNSGVTLEIFTPWSFSNLSDTNDRSVITRLTYRKTSFLFAGDAEDPAEAVMLANSGGNMRKKLDVDVLKVGHHGSDTSSTANFVMAISPQVAVISSGEKDVGANARYKHPRYSTIETYSTWFGNIDKGNSPPQHPDNGKVWAFDAAKKVWRQTTRPRGLWLTAKDGTVVVRSDGEKLDVSFQ